jgi:long-chain fatty acid transport protein
MKRIIKQSAAALAVAAAIGAPAAYATDGYFLIGYGAKARGMGGAGIALPQDSIAAATNPAGMAFVSDRADFGLELFSPRRYGGIDATPLGGADTGHVDSSSNIFAVPNGGYVHHMGGGLTLGISVTGAGGMNTRYDSNVYLDGFGKAVPGFVQLLNANGMAAGAPSSFPNTGTLGVNLSQAIIAPTAAFKVNDNNSIGASLLIGYQMFRAYGLGLFSGFSSDPAALTNNGNDSAWGAGVRIGWTGKISDNVTLGATAASKIYMQKFSKYKGLFAEQGDFDIPANFGVGIAVKTDPKTTVAFDVERILYSGVKSLHNPGPTAAQFVGGLVSTLTQGQYGGVSNPLGTNNGYGFGWNDQTVYKLGVQYQYNDQWTFRGGVNYAKSPIPDNQALFNVLAPGVVQTHLTLGFTYSPTKNNELTVAYMHAFQHDQSYTYKTTVNLPNTGAMPISYTTDIGMHQDALEASYAWKF